MSGKVKSRKAKNDVIFVLIVFALVGIFALVLFLTQTKGDSVVVLVDGKVFGEYSLSSDTTVEIKSEYGTNILEIKNGFADMLSADCPDGICVAHRPVSNGGESIICLPNKVVVEVHSSKNNDKDIVA